MILTYIHVLYFKNDKKSFWFQFPNKQRFLKPFSSDAFWYLQSQPRPFEGIQCEED